MLSTKTQSAPQKEQKLKKNSKRKKFNELCFG